MAGLSAALDLHDAGHEVTVLEAGDRVGGRVRTDGIDGHLVDRGFQVVLEAYPDLWDLIDPVVMDLKFFIPGARIRAGGSFHKVADPFQDPASILQTLRAPVGSLVDKTRIVGFRRAARKGSLDDLWQRDESTAAERLRRAGFSTTMIDRFLKPLFAGITLAPELEGSSRVLEFVFRMMSQGGVGVPAEGMAAIPARMLGRLPDDAVRLSTPVARVSAHAVELESGESIEADAVVVATDQTTAAALCDTVDVGWRRTTTAWFAAESSPLPEPILALNGEGVFPVNTVAVMSDLAPAYAPDGASTIAVSAPTIEPGLVDAMRTELRQWFGPAVDDWTELRVDEIEQALPAHGVGHNPFGPLQAGDGVWVCGDHRTDPSTNGAVVSGRAVARAIDALADHPDPGHDLDPDEV